MLLYFNFLYWFIVTLKKYDWGILILREVTYMKISNEKIE